MIFRLTNISDWGKAKDLLRPAFCGVFQVDDIEDYEGAIINGDAQLWVAEDQEIIGAVLTTFDEGKRGRVLQVRYLGGSNLRRWKDLMEESLTNFAKEHSCVHIEGWTRKGFSRLIKSFKPQGLELFVKVL